VNQVITREEVAALLQEMAEAESERRELDQAKNLKRRDNSSKAKDHRNIQRWYLVGSKR
jgi:hypothetical protein